MTVEMVCLIPGYFSWVSSSGTSSLSSWEQCYTFYCLMTIKDMFFDQQAEIKIFQNRVRDCFSHS